MDTKSESTLSIFVDESGSFDSSVIPSRFYLISFVFHDQSRELSSLLAELEMQLEYLGFPSLCIHAGPLVRREDVFAGMDLPLRRKLFGRMIAFARKAPVRYCAFCVDKRYCNTPQAVEASLFEQVVACLDQNRQLFSSYRQIKVYYDNGQAQVRELLKRAFAAVGATFAENVAPGRYRLFQVADLVCTIELLKAKLDVGIPLTKSELRFFNDIRELKKNYIRPLARIRL